MGKITKSKFLRAIEGTIGNKTAVAENLGVARQSLYDWLEKNPDMEEELEKEKDKLIVLAERKIIEKVNKNDNWAINKVLSTIGKKRGWSEVQEVNIKQISLNLNAPIEDEKREELLMFLNERRKLT